MYLRTVYLNKSKDNEIRIAEDIQNSLFRHQLMHTRTCRNCVVPISLFSIKQTSRWSWKVEYKGPTYQGWNTKIYCFKLKRSILNG